MMTRLNFLAFSLLIGVTIMSCNNVQKVTDVFIQPTDRELYARNFEENDSLYSRWLSAYNLRKFDTLQIKLPYVEQGRFIEDRNEILSFNTQVRQGERLIATLEGAQDSTKVFISLFLENNLNKDEKSIEFEGLLKDSRMVILENGTDAFYKIMIQPELKLQTDYVLKIYTEPTYAFPVLGHTNKSIGSFWGAMREGGKRSHKGIDIFAKRGTPVVAVVEGIVGKTGNYGLGGKQVWIREKLFGNSLYYAHLDSIRIETGKRVKIGDTLGFVGNTGNAKTTAPHLHFGIYKGYHGAIDPLPFIKESELFTYNEENISVSGRLKTAPSNIRLGPSIQFETILTVQEKFEVSILGKSKDWYHIELPSGIAGYIHESLVIMDSATIIS